MIVLVAIVAIVGVAGMRKWRYERFLDLAEQIAPCDPEQLVLRKTASLGLPERDEHHPSWREMSWTRSGRRLSVVLVERPSTRELVVGVVTVGSRHAPGGADSPDGGVAYEDARGLRECK